MASRPSPRWAHSCLGGASLLPRAFGSIALALLLSLPARAQQPIAWDAVEQEATRLLSEYIRVNTSNPPGNEVEAARFLRGVLERDGIEVEVWEPAPGKANLIARLRGSGARRPVILLPHMDVVPADPRYWSVDPFGGVVKDGYVWGRGTLDTKSLGITQLTALLTLKRQGVALGRDVIYLATSDEEIGGVLGAGDAARNHFDAFRDAEFVLNEGGSITADESGRTLYYGILTAEKAPFWLEMIARGEPGHGSIQRDETGPNRLVRALEKVRAWAVPFTAPPVVEQYFKGIAPTVEPSLRPLYGDVRRALRDPAALAKLPPRHLALLRNTISITVIQGSSKTNVIPPEARAELDVRLLPGQDPQAFLGELRRVVGDDDVEIRPLGLNWPAPVSATDSDLYRALEKVARAHEPGALVTPIVQTGFTDCHYFLERGIGCYGFAPVHLPESDVPRIHGNDERIAVRDLGFGARFLYDLLLELGGSDGER